MNRKELGTIGVANDNIPNALIENMWDDLVPGAINDNLPQKSEMEKEFAERINTLMQALQIKSKKLQEKIEHADTGKQNIKHLIDQRNDCVALIVEMESYITAFDRAYDDPVFTDWHRHNRWLWLAGVAVKVEEFLYKDIPVEKGDGKISVLDFVGGIRAENADNSEGDDDSAEQASKFKERNKLVFAIKGVVRSIDDVFPRLQQKAAEYTPGGKVLDIKKASAQRLEHKYLMAKALLELTGASLNNQDVGSAELEIANKMLEDLSKLYLQIRWVIAD